MPSVMVSPLELVYNGIWSMVEQSAALTELVRPGNFIKWNDPSFAWPDKDEISDADLPELGLAVTQMLGKLRATSSGSSVVARYEWLLATGDPSVVRVMLPVMWAVFAALVDWPVTALELEWPVGSGQSFVKRVDLLEANCGLAEPARNRGIRGWSSIWACEVEMWFATRDVKDSQELVS